MAPRKIDLHLAEKAAAKNAAAADLVHYVKNLQQLADGGFEMVEEYFEPAGLITIDEQPDDDDGIMGAIGQTNTRHQRRPRKVLAYPDLPAEQLVLVKRKRTVTAPDRASNIYLIDMIVGKPVSTTIVNPEAEGGQPAGLEPEDLEALYIGVE